MGDRGNIVIKEADGGQIYLYTHWGGSGLLNTLRAALKRGRSRWDDEAYLTRIIFSEMIKNDLLGETGYGISTYCQDQDRPDIVVNVSSQTISYEDFKISFDKFISQ